MILTNNLVDMTTNREGKDKGLRPHLFLLTLRRLNLNSYLNIKMCIKFRCLNLNTHMTITILY